MALETFWANVRRAVRLDGPRSVTDGLRLDPGQVAGGEDNWLFPRTVAAYDPTDFGHLGDERRQQFDQLVRTFSSVAIRKAVGDAVPPPDIETARDALRGIVKELEFDRFADAEAYRVGRTIEGLRGFPGSAVADARYQVRKDSNGEPSVKIMVYLTEGDREQFPQRAMAVRREIADLVLQSGMPYWPYVSTREASDLSDLQTVEVGE